MRKLFIVIVLVSTVAAGIAVFFYNRLPQPQPNKEQLQADFENAKDAFEQDVADSHSTYAELLSIEQYLDSLTKRQKAGSLFMVNIFGSSLTDDAKQLIKRNHPGGIIMMSGNIIGPLQLSSLISDVRSSTDYELLIAVDQEGYPVARVGWEKYADSNTAKLGESSTPKEIAAIYSSRSKQLANLGFDINFAPVADIAFPNSWITDRAFSSDAEEVAKILTAIFKEAVPKGVEQCAKHFPGLGRSDIDSHAELPVIAADKNELLDTDILPYKSIISEGAQMIMVGHAKYPNLDKGRPASVSKTIQTDILRDELGFNGVIVSDDMKMGALNNVENRYAKAVLAGTNIVVLIDTYDQIDAAVTQVSTQIDETILEERLRKTLKTLY
ncbi:MAG: glycoside hydrolase family 3 N-terminal domain-containing protein [Candidatus Dojkabacteria bacterium]